MLNVKVQPDRRQYQRFQVQDGAYLRLRHSDTGLGRLIDISMRGLAFYYVGTKPPSFKATELEIFVTDGGFRLHGIPCHSIWDLALYEIPTTSLQKRRCGVQFGELTESQIAQLEYFIQNYTTGEQPALGAENAQNHKCEGSYTH